MRTATDGPCHNYLVGKLFGKSPPGDPAREGSAGKRIVRNPILAALLFGAVALAIFLMRLSTPATMFYDEGYYVPAAKAILIGAPNPNPEAPPLGKLLIAVAIKTAGDSPFGWRIAGSVCGALTLTAVFLWTYLLMRDFQIACIAAALTLLNNFLFVMSRVAMMDAFLVFFLLWGLVAYTAALELDLRAGARRMLLCSAGALLGLACACKWNAVDTLAVLLVASFALYWMANRSTANANPTLFRYSRNLQQIGIPSVLLCLTIVPVLFYSLTYYPLCRSLHLPFGIHQLVTMNQFIWRFHLAVVGNKPITSAWYTWPLNTSPQRALSYLLGNPVVMWLGLAALLNCLWRFWKSLAVAEGLVVLLYAANLLQWAVTPAKGTFYYYYYPAAMFLGVAVALALRSLPRSIFGVRVSVIVLTAAAVIFLWCYPRMALLEPPWDCALGCWS